MRRSTRRSLTEGSCVCRRSGDVVMVPRERVDFMDVSPKQLVSVAAALILSSRTTTPTGAHGL
jgi:DNA-directed RNA polymerase subunit beta